ncbi:aromatic acid exporter family protein [Streptomyces sp. CNQ085]|uniref:FUSC family protein n=1 Tax=Streptomyces sp. CNQ085 TaxID=2886944 RepID=UPI001F504EAB|nr:aromatic acid exporter family protein [Streptomyces sp. CNQ085]MCI0384545.1 aromatic acid exporter family protein [Streptomyces sp. CNQ085]
MVHTQSGSATPSDRPSPSARAVRAVRAEVSWGARSLRRARRGPGRERDAVVQSLKAALAAVLAWLAAAWLLPDAFALMAPWVAVVLVQATVYRSVWQGLQQTAAIALGTVLAAALVIPFGHPVLVMILVLPVTTLLGNWPRFGAQGIYASTAALFTLVPGEATPGSAVSRVLAALLGTAVGVGVNALLLPPVHLRSAREAVDSAVREAREIVTEVADGLDEPWEHDRVRGWYDRACQLPRLVRGLESAVGWSRESTRLNPESRRRAEAARLTAAYAETLTTLEDIAERLTVLTRTLVEAAGEGDDVPRPGHEVTRPYSGFLRRVADALGAYGRTVTGDDPETARRELREAVGEIRAEQDRLRAELPRHAAAVPEGLAVLGPLLAESRRLAAGLLPGGRGEGDGDGDAGGASGRQGA